jgi:HSP20 family protein
MARDLVQFMQSFFMPGARLACATDWCPATDVYRTPNGWLVKMDLAGVNPDELQIRVAGRQVSVCGVRRDMRIEEGQSHYQMEIAYSSFHRTIELPCLLDQAPIATEYRDGMLLVRIQIEETQP